MQNQKRIDTYTVFQSTRPSRGETHGTRIGAFFLSISIHSPLAGRDHHPGGIRRCGEYFNPLAPRGARLHCSAHSLKTWAFQSTRPSQGETVHGNPLRIPAFISIHSPLAGRDQKNRIGACGITTFQSTRPSRGETESKPLDVSGESISIHSPLAGRDHHLFAICDSLRLFQSTRPSRGETGRAARRRIR